MALDPSSIDLEVGKTYRLVFDLSLKARIGQGFLGSFGIFTGTGADERAKIADAVIAAAKAGWIKLQKFERVDAQGKNAIITNEPETGVAVTVTILRQPTPTERAML